MVLVALALSWTSLEDGRWRRRSRRLRRRRRWDRSRGRWVGPRRGRWRRWLRPWLRRFRPRLGQLGPRLGVDCSSRRPRRTNLYERDRLCSTAASRSAPLRLCRRPRFRPRLSGGHRGRAQARQRAERRTLKLELKCRRSRDEHLLGRREVQRRAPQVTSAHRRNNESGQPQGGRAQHRRQFESTARRRG